MARSLRDIYGSGRFGLSIEIFPPKSTEGDDSLRATLAELVPFAPDFVSCTYGAGGSTSKRTIAWCREIQEKFGRTATAHFTCVGSTCDDLMAWLAEAAEAGINNIMALRGDAPAGQESFKPVEGGLRYANELVELIRKHHPGMGVGVGCYPEKHPEAPSLEVDLDNLRRKVDAGADALFTQLFFDNSVFFRFREECQRRKIKAPVVPGVMPITEYARIQRITALCGATIPAPLVQKLEQVREDKDAQFEIGVDYAIQQCRELIDQGVPGLHLYALNKSHACRRILEALGFGQ